MAHKTNRPTTPITDRYTTWRDAPPSPGIPQRLTSVDADDESMTFVADTIEWLRAEITSLGGPRAVEHYLASATGFDERCDRWASIRILERATGCTAPGRAWPGWRPDDPHARRRPLRPLELICVRLNAVLRRSVQEKGIERRSATVATIEAGGTAGELGLLLPGDVEFDGSVPVRLRLAGTEREFTAGFQVAIPRTVEIPHWARPSFAKVVEQAAGPEHPLLLRASNKAVGAQKIASTLLDRVTDLLDSSGLHEDRTVQPASIRNGAARIAYQQHGIDAAVARLGHDIDYVRGEIGLTPRRPARRDARPAKNQCEQ